MPDQKGSTASALESSRSLYNFSCKRYPPSLPYIIFVQTCGKRLGPFQICGCPFREPRVFKIAHIHIYIYCMWFPWFPPIWDGHPHSLIFFKGVDTGSKKRISLRADISVGIVGLLGYHVRLCRDLFILPHHSQPYDRAWLPSRQRVEDAGGQVWLGFAKFGVPLLAMNQLSQFAYVQHSFGLIGWSTEVSHNDLTVRVSELYVDFLDQMDQWIKFQTWWPHSGNASMGIFHSGCFWRTSCTQAMLAVALFRSLTGQVARSEHYWWENANGVSHS